MARILVVGSSNTDMTVVLPCLPAPGETRLGGVFLIGAGGKGANQAVAAARAGADVTFLTAVGDDSFGRQTLEGLKEEGVGVDHARVLEGEASGVALIFVGERGENMIGVAPGANARLVAEDVDRLPDGLFRADGLLLIAGLEVPIAVAERAAVRGRNAGMRVVLNPAPADESLVGAALLTHAEVVTPNRGELGAMTGRPVNDETEVRLAARSLVERGAGGVVVTLGSEGCLVVTRESAERIPSHRVDVRDTVGAGDAFSGALAVALAEGRTLLEAAEWATAAAAVAVTRPGARSAMPRRDEIDRRFRLAR
jgi:ribokinase